jgi:uncharacterized lipoprotein YmbA
MNMTTMWTAGVSLAAILGMAGCAGHVPEVRYYQLGGAGAPASGGGAVLAIEPLDVGSAYADDRMVYRVNPYRLDYYDYHRWSAEPGVLVANYLERALEASGRFRAVVPLRNSDASVVLGGRIAAIEEVDLSPTRWEGRIVLELYLKDAASGRVVWSDAFEETERLRVQSPEGLARALSAAMSRISARIAPEVALIATERARVAAARATPLD